MKGRSWIVAKTGKCRVIMDSNTHERDLHDKEHVEQSCYVSIAAGAL